MFQTTNQIIFHDILIISICEVWYDPPMPAMPAMAILPQKLGGCGGRVESSGAGQRVAGPNWKKTIG